MVETRAKHEFKVVSDYQPAGDQPQAIAQLTLGVERGDRFQTLLGITQAAPEAKQRVRDFLEGRAAKVQKA